MRGSCRATLFVLVSQNPPTTHYPIFLLQLANFPHNGHVLGCLKRAEYEALPPYPTGCFWRVRGGTVVCSCFFLVFFIVSCLMALTSAIFRSVHSLVTSRGLFRVLLGANGFGAARDCGGRRRQPMRRSAREGMVG